jgi:peptidoglycan/xylan/chitin deacetylase (PgdA/CDA1 family)
MQSLHAIRSFSAHNDHVYLSFDDGPDAEWTPRMLDLLAAAEVQATFFVIGCHARTMPALVRRVLAEGHALGNHSFSHRHPWSMSAAAARNEVCDGAAVIADLTGRVPTLFRPPHGRLRRAIYEAAAETAQAIVLWNRSAIDWGPLGAATQIAARLAGTQPGDIVLMHDARNCHNQPQELALVLPSFLQQLAVRQLKCTRISP